jgi:hypothetical protein
MLRKITLGAALAALTALTIQSPVQAYGGFHGGYTHVGAGGVSHVGYGGYGGYRGADGYRGGYGYAGRGVPLGTGYTARDLGYGAWANRRVYGPAIGYPAYGYGVPAAAVVTPSVAPFSLTPQAASSSAGATSQPTYQPGSGSGNVVPSSTASGLLSSIENATAPSPPAPPTYVYSPSYSQGQTSSSKMHGMGIVQ